MDWRALLQGWRAHYVPTAVAYHERRVRRMGLGCDPLLRFLPGTLRQRREIQGRATAPREEIHRWFVRYPYGERMLRCLGRRPAR